MTDDKATPAVTSLTIRSIERDLERTPSGRGGIIRHDPATRGMGASGTPGDNLLADWRELEAALAAERDRADRAEARLASALEIADVWIESEPSDPAPISVVTAGRVFRGLLTSEATA